MNKKILLVEDDENLGIVLTDYLSLKGYDVQLAKDGEQGFNKFSSDRFDILILDVMMPKLDGFNLTKKIRAKDKNTPIIFLTAKSMIEDRIEGLKLGADDYLTKPFSTEELLLRIFNILKRAQKSPAILTDSQTEFKLGKFYFDYNKRKLGINNKEIILTSKESELLRLLSLYQNQLLERTTALEIIWNEDNYFNSRSMDVYISKLRRYLKDDASIKIINMHGSGFKLVIAD